MAWLITLALLGLAIYLGWQRLDLLNQVETRQPVAVLPTQPFSTDPPRPTGQEQVPSLPAWNESQMTRAIARQAEPYTIIPSRPRQEALPYTVDIGDSVFAIAQAFGLTPETILWANYDTLKDNPHAISVGMELQIPPVNGVYYQWQAGDRLPEVAARFEAELADILTFSGNRLDLVDPQIQPETWIMIPGGQREFQQWIVPIIPRGAAGVSTGVYGGGACEGGYEGLYGSGAFIWPAQNHYISGNDYWSGHLAIDIGASLGEAIVAADSGVVVFAGWATGGYGNTVAIDHGNGYQTLYAHLSQVSVGCGQSVRQGQLIGRGGSTGNSTGPHLHFEVRYQGGFVNPWYVLPAP
ncbi:MAG: M23 family metallopeptidase [Anaerolineales bacterium]|nr:M23 family metallopeptidase [Anaerolineales bacterium]